MLEFVKVMVYVKNCLPLFWTRLYTERAKTVARYTISY